MVEGGVNRLVAEGALVEEIAEEAEREYCDSQGIAGDLGLVVEEARKGFVVMFWWDVREETREFWGLDFGRYVGKDGVICFFFFFVFMLSASSGEWGTRSGGGGVTIAGDDADRWSVYIISKRSICVCLLNGATSAYFQKRGLKRMERAETRFVLKAGDQ